MYSVIIEEMGLSNVTNYMPQELVIISHRMDKVETECLHCLLWCDVAGTD